MALDNGIDVGVWGGMTNLERRALLRKHPDIKSWGKLFSNEMLKEVAGE
jgi:WhiB family redox-sensing transcriptional regulator